MPRSEAHRNGADEPAAEHSAGNRTRRSVHQGRLNNLTEKLGHQLLSVPLRVMSTSCFSAISRKMDASVSGGNLNTYSLGQARVHANPIPLTEQVNGAVLGLNTLSADSLRAALIISFIRSAITNWSAYVS